MHVVTYVRVSTEEQFGPGKVSISEQAESIRAYVQRHGWTVAGAYSDVENYVATGKPKKGKPVNPSATRDDRPGFQAMLAHVRTGQIDAIVCFRDDRLYRHERVVTALLDAIDDAEQIRRAPVEVHQAAGIIARDFMYLQAMMWRKENEARASRMQMGKLGTLRLGLWPGQYNRLGYRTEPAERGNRIVIDESAAATVRAIYDWYEAGHTLKVVSRLLITDGHVQPGGARPRRLDWGTGILYSILSSEDYTGRAVWKFASGEHVTVPIPQIITPEQFGRVQARLKASNTFSPRRAKHHHYLLAGLAYCGFCGRKLVARTEIYSYYKRPDGTPVRAVRKIPKVTYGCNGRIESAFPDCPGMSAVGLKLEWNVWRALVNKIIRDDKFLDRWAELHRAELLGRDDGRENEIAKKRRYLAGLEERRASTRSRYARGGLGEADLEAILAEIDRATLETQAELSRLFAARGQAALFAAGLDSARELIAGIRARLAEIDIPPEALRQLPADVQAKIYQARQTVARQLCRRVEVANVEDFVIEVVIGGGDMVLRVD